MEKPTYVYAIECAGFIKIGLAECTKERLSGLRPNCPLPMSLVARRQFSSKEDARKAERACHRALKGQRETGEWFRPGPKNPVEVLLNVYQDMCPDAPVAELIDGRRPRRAFDVEGYEIALSAVIVDDLWAAHQ